jgi:hypothetical protein
LFVRGVGGGRGGGAGPEESSNARF